MRFCALLFGLVLITLGFAGFESSDGWLFTIFRVNFWLNLFHALTGILCCVIAFLKLDWIRLFFQIFGIVYALLAILGFAYGDQDIFGIIASNAPNTWLHVIAATNALILGYGSDDNERVRL